MMSSIMRKILPALMASFLLPSWGRASDNGLEPDAPVATVEQRTTRCQLREDQVPQAATALIRALRVKGRSLNSVLPIQLSAQIEGENTDRTAEHLQKNIIFEGFMRPDKGFRRVVPGLGIGVEITSKTLIYACLDLQPNNTNNQLTLLFLEASGLDARGFLPPRAHFSASNVQLRALNEATHILSHIPLVGRIFDSLPVVTGVAFLESRVYDLVNTVAGIGVRKIVVRPNVTTFETSAQIGRVARFSVGTQSIPLDSSWMISAPGE